MGNYLFIESRDPFDSRDSHDFLFALATALARAGTDVAVLLVQNGAFVARRGAAGAAVEAALQAGVRMYVDEFALRERGIGLEMLPVAIRPAPLDMVVDRMVDGTRVIWH